MKKNTSRTSVLTLCFVIMIVILYIKFLGSFGINKDVPLPTGLHPMVAERTQQLVHQAGALGINIIITDDFRSFEAQDQLYAKGRTQTGSIVTYAEGGESYHNFGLAIDFAIVTSSGEAIWDMTFDGNGNSKSDWMEVVELAKGLGFEWGGDWKNFKDYPHFQMDFGLSIRDLQRGKRPPES